MTIDGVIIVKQKCDKEQEAAKKAHCVWLNDRKHTSEMSVTALL